MVLCGQSCFLLHLLSQKKFRSEKIDHEIVLGYFSAFLPELFYKWQSHSMSIGAQSYWIQIYKSINQLRNPWNKAFYFCFEGWDVTSNQIIRQSGLLAWNPFGSIICCSGIKRDSQQSIRRLKKFSESLELGLIWQLIPHNKKKKFSGAHFVLKLCLLRIKYQVLSHSNDSLSIKWI